MQKEIKLSNAQKHALVNYVIMLMEAGADAIYVGDVLPRPKFEAFPELTDFCIALLYANGISYDKPSGWFRKVKED